MRASAGRRVLMLLEDTPYSFDNRVQQESRALVAAGYQVTVICPSRAGQPWHATIDGVQIYCYPEPATINGFLGYLWEYTYALLATFILSLIVLVRSGFDVVHTHCPPDGFVVIAAFYKLLGKRYVYDHHDLSPELYVSRFGERSNGLVLQALVWLEKLSCRLADHVIATNQSYKAVEMQRGGVPEERITIVRNGPNLERIRLVDPDPELRSKGKTIIGYVGVMGPQDGVDYLLRALHHLLRDLGRSDFFCVIIGKGDAIPDLKQLATQLGLDDHVWFTGRISNADLARYLSTADICVDPDPSNPLNDRSTMTKIMEYMALAKPVVAFDLTEHRFSAQSAALYVRPNDELEFARALARLMDDPELRRAMGTFGRRRVEEELAWVHWAPVLVEAYNSLFAPHKGKGVPVIND